MTLQSFKPGTFQLIDLIFWLLLLFSFFFSFCNRWRGGRYNMDGIGTGWTFRVRIREGAREFFLSLNFLASKPLILWILGSFPGAWCWHLPPSYVVKNEWSCTSAPSTCFVMCKGMTLIHYIVLSLAVLSYKYLYCFCQELQYLQYPGR
jgi:hypothetical protein